MMDKFDEIRMKDLVRVEDPDSDGGLTIVFKDGKSLKVRISGDKLECDVQG